MLGGFIDHARKVMEANLSMKGSKRKLSVDQIDDARKRAGKADPESMEELMQFHRSRLDKNRKKRKVLIWTLSISLAGILTYAYLAGDTLTCSLTSVDGRSKVYELTRAGIPYNLLEYDTTIIGGSIQSILIKMDNKVMTQTLYQTGRKNYISESFYPSGQIFRRASYQNGIMSWENYYTPSGEVIPRFPYIFPDKLYSVTIKDSSVDQQYCFELLGHSILPSTFSGVKI